MTTLSLPLTRVLRQAEVIKVENGVIMTELPKGVSQGEPARLFPVLSTTSKEGRTTSIVLACLEKVTEFRTALLGSVGQRVGVRSTLTCFTEVCFGADPKSKDASSRPDGLMVLKTGSREWAALVEAKVGNAPLQTEQIERYRQIAKENGLDCVITISNQFATDPASHPLEEVRKSKSKIPVYHWSWMHILTQADLLLSRADVADEDQEILLHELHRFLSHESAGVKGFERMPPEWADLNKLVASGGAIAAKSADAIAVLEAWHQETRDLSLILSRMTETLVSEKLAKKHKGDPAQRLKDEMALLREENRIECTLDIVGAAAPLMVSADLARRCISVGMKLRAPEDKKTSKARLNWLLRQLKNCEAEDMYIRCLWPGKSEPTQATLAELREGAENVFEGKDHLAAHGFEVFLSRKTGGRFAQLANFIVDLEAFVPEFYRLAGMHLRAWQKPAPVIREAEPEVAEE